MNRFPSIQRLFATTTAMLIIAASPAGFGAEDQPVKEAAPKAAAKTAAPHRCKPGPWGDLEYVTAYLEVSTSILRLMDLWPAEPMWRFVNESDEAIEAILTNSGLPEPMLKQLLDRKCWRKQGPVTSLLPSPEIVLAIPAEAREKLYTELAKSPENVFHLEPFPIYGGNVRAWLEGAHLRPEIIDAIERTSYTRFGTKLFSDVSVLYSLAQTDAERLGITKALSRTPTLMLKLRIKSGFDLGKVADYWTAGFKRKDIEPFIESLMRNPAAEKLDIIHLLPPTARKLLNTFPHPTQYVFFGQLPDCHWSSLNFFNYDTLPRLANETMAAAFVAENYSPTSPPFQFGDVLFFTDASGSESYHSCVYIADDIVFTKNGRSVLRPWALMKMDDVAALYRKEPDIHINGYRRKRAIGE